MMKSISIRGKSLISRFFFAPINTGFSIDGSPTYRLKHFHKNRSGRSIGISYVGNVAISEEYKTNRDTLVLRPEVDDWYDLSKIIRDEGSLAGIQLGCRYYKKPASRSWRILDRNSLIKEYREFISSLDDDDIQELMDKYVLSAELSLKYNFDVVQIHAAHGYFLSLLLNKNINWRKGKFSFANVGGLDCLIKRIRHLDNDFLLDFRFSCIDGLYGDDQADEEWADRMEQIIKLSSIGLDIVSLSAGLYDFSKKLIYPPVKKEPSIYLKYAEQLVEKVSCNVNVAGNIKDLDVLDNGNRNISYGIGRPLIADPAFIEKSLKINKEKIVACEGSGRCHYYTRNLPNIMCKVNQDI